MRWARDALWVALSRAGLLVGSVIVAAVASRVLGSSGYGVFTSAAVFAATASLFLLGIPQATLREVATATARGDAAGAREAMGSGCLLLLVLGALGGLVLVAASDLFAGWTRAPSESQEDLRTAIQVAGGLVFLAAVIACSDTALQGHRAFRAAAMLTVGSVAAGWVVVVAVLTTGATLSAALVALWVGPVLTAFALAAAARRSGIAVMPVRAARRPRVAALLRTGFPIFVNDATFVVQSRLDAILLLVLAADATTVVGHYNAAFQVALCTVIPPRLFIGTFLPAVAQMAALAEHAKIAPAIRRVTGFIVLAVLPIAVGGVILRERILVTVFTPEFAAGSSVLGILLVAYALNAAMYPCTAALIGLGRPSAISWNVVPMAVAIVVLQLVLIPRHGMTGAALGAGIPIALGALAFPWQTASELRRHGSPTRVRDLVPWRLLVKCGSAAAVMAIAVVALATLVPGVGLGVLVVAGAVVYAGAFLLLRGLDPEDRRLLRDLVRPGVRR